MDQSERYLQLTLLGRESFVKSVAPAALVRKRSSSAPPRPMSMSEVRQREKLVSGYSEDTLLAHLDGTLRGTGTLNGDLDVFPLAKKPGAPFADMITVGRTSNNDVVLKDVTVSRFHAFFRERDGVWYVCDAGSKNGTMLRGAPLPARKETELTSGDVVRIGDIVTTFYTAEDLFEVLCAA
ncbi:FHA domain-containing protein [Haliangium sp.]|uniref:FHA domain-containing protein n=1 Tax=Haliangium sp. TaxID=2663208 RepID=UPI003D13F5F4